MENDREVDSVLMNIKNTTGGVLAALTFSARASWKLLAIIGRLAKKGLVAGGLFDNFKDFHTKTGGDYTTYNIPLSEGKAKLVSKMQQLELELEQSGNPFKKAAIRREIAGIEKNIPELQQLRKIGITYCTLPKINGTSNTIQVAVAKKDDQHFKNWFLNHLTANMTGGQKSLETLKVFTEGNYSVLNMPFEGAEELGVMLSDFNTMGINFSVLPDLNVGDGYTQLAIANTDRSQVENWFKMWKQKLLQEGKEAGEMYEINSGTYVSTAECSPDDFIKQAEPVYQEANKEFEEKGIEKPWMEKLAHENSPEFVKLSQDRNYEKITINRGKLVDFRDRSEAVKALENAGFFLSRLPGYFNEKDKQLVLPKDKVFTTDNNQTFVAFLDKRKMFQVLNVGTEAKAEAGADAEMYSFEEIKKIYDTVNRGFKKTESMAKTQKPAQNLLNGPIKPIS